MTDENTTDSAPTRFWLRILAGCVLLTGVAFMQSPGYVIADTKFDLAVNPADFLARSLHLWDAQGAFGQLQNQAYGYLWPMGPFFWLGDLVGLPDWVVQRFWLALVMCVAFAGAARVARALGVRSDLACLVAAAAYATSPRLLSTLGPISIEAWPSAVAPWVLLPLIIGAERGSPRRAAALSALAIAMVGGVNAAATAAVLPLGAVWLLTRKAGPRRRSMMLWWPTFTLLATSWWLVPLFTLGEYSPPFLDFIETASITTFPTTVTDAVRGTSAWVPYIDSSWHGGNDVVTLSYIAANAAILVLLGLTGLLLRENPHRLFLTFGLAAGLLLVTMGHLGSVQGWAAGSLNQLLDGSLAPIRNVHKFDPVIRLPMVLGLAWFLQLAAEGSITKQLRIGSAQVRVASHASLVLLAVVAVAGAAGPAIVGNLAPTRPVLETPSYWDEASAWLAKNSDDGQTALLAPGSGFADYLWGNPRDEPMQYAANTEWAVRNAIPLTPAGNIRMLDRIESALRQGEGSPALASALRRAGVRYLVVRNDLRSGAEVTHQSMVHEALGESPGINFEQGFGPVLDDANSLTSDQGRFVIEGGRKTFWNAVEIFSVEDVPAAVVAPEPSVVVGGPEDLLDLIDADLIGDAPVELAVDHGSDPPTDPTILTDGFVDRERFFGRLGDGVSSALVPGDIRRTGNPTRNYLPDGAETWLSRMSLLGASSLSASSSASDANAAGGASTGRSPYAAVDDSPSTQWQSGGLAQKPAWWRVDLESEVTLSSVQVRVGSLSGARMMVRARTAQGAGEPVELNPDSSPYLAVPSGPTDFIALEVVGNDTRQLAIADVSWPGRDIERTLATPELPEGWSAPATILLRRLTDGRHGCVKVGGRAPCSEQRVVESEEETGLDRLVRLPASQTYQLAARATPQAGPALDALIQQGLAIQVSASSSGVADPRGGAVAALDGDPGTAWTPRVDDPRPQLRMSWLGKRLVSGVQIRVPDDMPVRRPTAVEIESPAGTEYVELDDAGRGNFPGVRTDSLTVTVVESDNAAEISGSGAVSQIPAGIAEINVVGVPFDPILLSADQRTYPCGSGPSLDINGTVQQTALRSSPSALFGGVPAPLVFCDKSGTKGGDKQGDETDEATISLQDGDNRIIENPSDAAALDRLVLTQASAAEPASIVSAAGVARQNPARATIDLGDSAGEAESSILGLRQNYNRGWVARGGSEDLEPVVLDGWQQGWRLDASDDPQSVVATFAPDNGYRWSLGLGLLLLLGLAIGTVVMSRRRTKDTALPPVGAATLPSLVVAVAAIGLGGLLAGTVGAVVSAPVVLFALAMQRVRESTADNVALLLTLPSAVAVGAYFVRPWGDSSGWAGSLSWPHYVMVAVLAFVLASAGRRRVKR